MSRLDISRNLATTSQQDLPSAIDMVLDALIDQWNGTPQIYPVNFGQLQPVGVQQGDLLVGYNQNGNPQFSFFDGNTNANLSQDTVTGYMGFVPPSSGVGIPTTTQFPQDGQWGYYTD